MDSQEIIERYLLLLLGVKPLAVPSALHLQKEMFLLANFKENLKEELDFKKHYYGPFSQIIEESIKSPSYLSEAFDFTGERVSLSEEGKVEFKKMLEENKNNEEFNLILSGVTLIRNIYDKLSREELLFLIYSTYPEYTALSNVSDDLLKNVSNRIRILNSLLLKGVITPERYEELKNG